MKRIKVTASTIRHILFETEKKLRICQGKMKTSEQYRRKVAYTLMWMRLIQCEKKTLEGWSMPDARTIAEMRKKQ